MAVRKVQLEYCYKSNYFAPSDDILTLQRYGVFLKLPNFGAANSKKSSIFFAESRETRTFAVETSRAVIFGWTHQPSFGNHGGKYDVEERSWGRFFFYVANQIIGPSFSIV